MAPNARGDSSGATPGGAKSAPLPGNPSSEIEVVERRIMPEEMATFSECFICGTGAEVTPVSEIGAYRFTPGELSRALIEDYSHEVEKQPSPVV